MSFFYNIILNMILVLFPIVIYFLLKIYFLDTKKDNYIFISMNILSMILVLIFSKRSLLEISLFIYLPLLFNYIKGNIWVNVIISFFMIMIYNYFFDINIYILILEYMTYLITYLIINKKDNVINFINKFIIIKAFFLSYYIFSIYYKNDLNINILYIVVYISTAYFFSFIFNYFLNQNINIKQIDEMNKRIDEQDNIRNYLCAVTHELKNSLTISKGYLDMLKNKKDKEKYLKIIKREVNRSIDMIQDGLNISKDKLNYEILDINVLLEDVISTLEGILKQNKIKYRINYIDDDVYILGDYEKLKQVIINVLKNSMESRNKDLIIEIDNHILRKEICISIKDNGCGIDNVNLIGSGYSNKIKGMGIGTTFSKNIVDKHNGKIIYESVKGEGTKVNILLPLFR